MLHLCENPSVHVITHESKKQWLESEILMRGGALFLIFFVLFGAASYAIPAPLFPGNIVLLFIDLPIAYAPLIEAIVNGIIYGCVVWLVSILVIRKFEDPKVTPVKAKKPRSLKRR